MHSRAPYRTAVLFPPAKVLMARRASAARDEEEIRT
jgi:hypothetical protein